MEFSLPFFEKLKLVARHPSFLLLFLYRPDHRIDDQIDFLMEGFERITTRHQNRRQLGRNQGGQSVLCLRDAQ